MPPFLEAQSPDAVIAAGQGHIAGDFVGMAGHRQAVSDLALLLSFVHQDFLSQGDHRCKQRSSAL
jgi:hypothetical protein